MFLVKLAEAFAYVVVHAVCCWFIPVLDKRLRAFRLIYALCRMNVRVYAAYCPSLCCCNVLCMFRYCIYSVTTTTTTTTTTTVTTSTYYFHLLLPPTTTDTSNNNNNNNNNNNKDCPNNETFTVGSRITYIYHVF